MNHSANQQERFAKVPNEVILDPRLHPVALQLLCLRYCFSGGPSNYALNVRYVTKTKRLMGKASFHRGLSTLIECGYLVREHKRSGGKFGWAVESLIAPAATDNGYAWVWMCLIELVPTRPFAVYVFLLANGPSRLADIAERFECGADTAKKWVEELMPLGLLEEPTPRTAGRFVARRYAAIRLSNNEAGLFRGAGVLPPRDCFPVRELPDTVRTDTEAPDTDFGPTHRGSTSTQDDIHKERSSTPQSHGFGCADAGPSGREAFRNTAFFDATQWIERAPMRDDLRKAWLFALADEEKFEFAKQMYSYRRLEQELLHSCDGRLARTLRTVSSLDQYLRVITAASTVSGADISEVHHYVRTLLEERTAGKGGWIYSWGYVMTILSAKIIEDRGVGEAYDYTTDAASDDDDELPF